MAMEDDELDELDELLNTMRAQRSSADEASDSFSVEIAPSAGISFSFPGLEIDFGQTAIVVRDVASRVDSRRSSMRSRVKITECSGAGCPISQIPDEILLKIFTLVEVDDLSASRQVCKRWNSLCSSDCLWDKFLGPNASSNLPRWLELKHNTTLFRIGARYTYLRKLYDFLIDAVEAWWEDGQPRGKYHSGVLCPLIRKLTQLDWCVFYELLGAAFAKRADTLTVELLRGLPQFSTGENHVSSSEETCAEKNCAAGVEIWNRLCHSWDRYISWIKLISLHCSDLNHEVRVERVRSMETPTLYNKGILCFRSQVILSYGLRRILQEGLSYLSARDAQGSASEDEVELLCSLHHLLQVLDVSDDFTLPAETFTRANFRRCFLDGESSRNYSRSQIMAARKENF